MLIDPETSDLKLGLPVMDETHAEFIDLVNQLEQADAREFKRLFIKLFAHTEQHFNAEDALMEQSHFPAIREHREEHRRVLGELHRIAGKVTRGSTTLGRAYVAELPNWFRLHLLTMDSALAAHLQRSESPLAANE